MKKTLIIFLFFISINAIAQRGNREHIKSLKIAFITERLKLTQKEAQEFWPVYNDFEEKRDEIKFKEIISIRRSIRKDIDEISDDKAITLLERLNKAESKVHVLKKEFSKKISGIISAKKVIQLKIAEDDFKRKMLQEFKRRRGPRKD